MEVSFNIFYLWVMIFFSKENIIRKVYPFPNQSIQLSQLYGILSNPLLKTRIQ
jgi:hypothetical protein